MAGSDDEIASVLAHEYSHALLGHVARSANNSMAGMAMKQSDPPRKPGRPPLPMPEQIPDRLENMMRDLGDSPPVKRDEWDYLKKGGSDECDVS